MLVHRVYLLTSPRDPPPYDNLQNVYAYQGKHEEALIQGLEVLRLRGDVSSYEDVALSLLCLNRLDEARATLQEAEQRKLQSELLQWLRYELAGLKGDLGEMNRLESASNQLGLPWLLIHRSMREAQVGRLR